MNPERKEVYFLLANAYEKQGLHGIGVALRIQGEKLKLQDEVQSLGWNPQITFENGLRDTIQ